MTKLPSSSALVGNIPLGHPRSEAPDTTIDVEANADAAATQSQYVVDQEVIFSSQLDPHLLVNGVGVLGIGVPEGSGKKEKRGANRGVEEAAAAWEELASLGDELGGKEVRYA